MLKAVVGAIDPQQARITLAGREISDLPTHRRIHLGLAMTHQLVRPFRSMTLRDNVALAVGHRRVRRVWKALAGLNRSAERSRAMDLLELVGIAEHADQTVDGKPLGVLKRLEVARALALEPRLLLLDEPLAGLNHVEAARLADTVARINREGLTVVMIEHNLGEVLRIGHRLVVLDNGRKIAQGPPREVMNRPTVRAAYVGKEEGDAAA
jgi:branched-chain amino acid transport system ATP-binding protein